MLLLTKKQIEVLLPRVKLLDEIEDGFVQYSQGKCIVPPIGELLLDKGEVHIKYGCIRGERFYVIKIASGFYQNPALGLASSNGLMQLFEQQTGQLAAILLDEGYLTDVRTAVAGAVCAKYFAPDKVEQIGIIGTGEQARLQALYLQQVLDCKRILLWGRNREHMFNYSQHMQKLGFEVQMANSPQQVCETSRLIVTTTPSQQPIIQADWIKPGTHITAVGSDTPEKQELDCQLLNKADLVVADSISQCQLRGEISQALNTGAIELQQLQELGKVIAQGHGRTGQQQISVVDLTGVAVQDIKIAEAVYLAAGVPQE